MDEVGIQFHIEENDYFGTVATVLDLVSQDLQKKGDLRNADSLQRLRDRLMHLQKGYRIARIELISKNYNRSHKPRRPSVACSLPDI